MIEKIEYNGRELGLIIRANYQADGVSFFTPDDYSQQLAYMHHKEGHVIIPHIHNHIDRNVSFTQEVLVIRKGVLRVDFYDDNRSFICDKMLYTNDVILLASGGHGFEVIEEVEMIEIKQGPYLGENDKVRFEPKEKKN